MGRITTCTVLRSSPAAGTSMRLLASVAMSAGVIRTDRPVETAVIETESGTSASAR